MKVQIGWLGLAFTLGLCLGGVSVSFLCMNVDSLPPWADAVRPYLTSNSASSAPAQLPGPSQGCARQEPRAFQDPPPDIQQSPAPQQPPAVPSNPQEPTGSLAGQAGKQHSGHTQAETLKGTETLHNFSADPFSLHKHAGKYYVAQLRLPWTRTCPVLVTQFLKPEYLQFVLDSKDAAVREAATCDVRLAGYQDHQAGLFSAEDVDRAVTEAVNHARALHSRHIEDLYTQGNETMAGIYNKFNKTLTDNATVTSATSYAAGLTAGLARSPPPPNSTSVTEEEVMLWWSHTAHVLGRYLWERVASVVLAGVALVALMKVCLSSRLWRCLGRVAYGVCVSYPRQLYSWWARRRRDKEFRREALRVAEEVLVTSENILTPRGSKAPPAPANPRTTPPRGSSLPLAPGSSAQHVQQPTGTPQQAMRGPHARGSAHTTPVGQVMQSAPVQRPLSPLQQMLEATKDIHYMPLTDKTFSPDEATQAQARAAVATSPR